MDGSGHLAATDGGATWQWPAATALGMGPTSDNLLSCATVGERSCLHQNLERSTQELKTSKIESSRNRLHKDRY